MWPNTTVTRARNVAGALLLLVVPLTVASSVEAKDRPGTPNQQVIFVCGYPPPTYAPVLCGQFNNTATEVVHIEFEATRNGQPYAIDASKINCSNMETHRVYATDPGGNKVWTGHFAPSAQVCYVPNLTFGRKPHDPDYPYVFKTPAVSWNAQYCMRFRARRVSDSVVSEKWSNYACESVSSAPPPPSRPEFSYTFSGSQSAAIVSGNAKPGETVSVIPSEVTIHVSPPSDHMQTYSFSDGATGLDWNAWEQAPKTTFALSPDHTTVALVLCAINFSGRACTTHNVDLVAQREQMQRPPNAGSRIAVPLTTPAPRPVRAAGVPGNAAAPATLPLADRLLPGVDLPGNDYKNMPISGAAVDCRNLCTADGACRAWTWVKPGVQGAQAMCWLKNAVPGSVSNPNATSGIKGTAAAH